MFDQLSGATQLYPIIGDPVMYVESPARLTHTFQTRKHNGVCVPMQVASDDLNVVMAGLSATANVEGVLVTMPHKFTAFAYCATLSARALILEAVSVLRRNDDRTWHGDMLDGVAFVTAQKKHGARLEGARALLVGAGGAGRAIAIELLEAGIDELIVNDADESRVSSLLDLMAHFGGDHVKAGPADPTGCDYVFNATPLGMEESDSLPINSALLDSSMFVGDVIAGHGVTPFIRAPQDSGCATTTGDDMVEAVQDFMAEFLLGGKQRERVDS